MTLLYSLFTLQVLFRDINVVDGPAKGTLFTKYNDKNEHDIMLFAPISAPANQKKSPYHTDKYKREHNRARAWLMHNFLKQGLKDLKYPEDQAIGVDARVFDSGALKSRFCVLDMACGGDILPDCKSRIAKPSLPLFEELREALRDKLSTYPRDLSDNPKFGCFQNSLYGPYMSAIRGIPTMLQVRLFNHADCPHQRSPL